MIYSVPIIIDEGVNPVFIKANRHILSNYMPVFKNMDYQEKLILLEKLWNEEYNVTIEKINNIWCNVCFPNNNAKTMFLLKWQ